MPYLSEEGDSGDVGGFNLAGSPSRAITQDEGHPGDGDCINDSEPFKEQFRHIPPLLLEEVHTSLRDMLDVGAIHPSQFPWCNVVVLV